MDESTKPTCSTCPYWSKVGFTDGRGACQKNAPRLIQLDTGELIADHAPKFPEEWCGEHPDFSARPAAVSTTVDPLAKTSVVLCYYCDKPIINVDWTKISSPCGARPIHAACRELLRDFICMIRGVTTPPDENF